MSEYFVEIIELLDKSISLAYSYFFDPDKRVYFIYLFTSAILAFLVYKKTKVKSSFWKYIFNKKVWLTKSAFVDYGLFLFNSLIKTLFIVPYVLLSLSIAFYVNDFLLQNLGFINDPLSKVQTIILYTLALTIINDLFSYLIHYLMHNWSFLWEFHKIHHSATKLNPLTQYRIHPIELIINNIRSIIVFGIITGIFDYISSNQINKLLFLGVNVFSFLFYILGANLRHSHVKLSYPKILEYFLISPYQHQIHHSINKEYYNKNLGSKFAIWDWLFGTLALSGEKKKLRFGIIDINQKYSSFWYNLYAPFKNISVKIFSFFQSR